MLAFVVSEATTKSLKELCRREDDEADESISLLRSQLAKAILPEQSGYLYDEKNGTILSHDCLLAVARRTRTLSSEDAQRYCLAEIMKGSKVAVPIRIKPERSPALIDALARIEREQEEREYAAMLPASYEPKAGLFDPISMNKHSRIPGQRQTSEEQEWVYVKQQMSAIVNILVSVAAVVTAVWWAGGTASPIWKTLVAILLGLLVAIAEAVLYARHWANIERKSDAVSLRRPR